MSGAWTEGKFNSFIKSALRAASQRWPPKFQALADAFVGKKVNSKTGRVGKHYKCNCCLQEFPSSEIQVDHILPVIDPDKGFISWDEVIKRMFCDKEGFQILCTTCHKDKTIVERRQATERRKHEKQQLQDSLPLQ